jgi:hypothetical protein
VAGTKMIEEKKVLEGRAIKSEERGDHGMVLAA